MSGSTWGKNFRIHTFGESHGKAIGVIIDGITPDIEINEEYIQKELDRRKPGQSSITTSRCEFDKIHILSGIFEGKTTGTPLAMLLYNKDIDSDAYNNIKYLFRPGHADYTYMKKYRIRDWRGSGRASGRETATRVAAGAIAKKELARRGISVVAFTKVAGGIECETINYNEIEKNVMRTACKTAAKKMLSYGIKLKEQNNSMGGIIECHIHGVPPGLGEPVFDKLDAMLAHAIMSIGAVKGFEIGLGFEVAYKTGIENNDQMNKDGFITNNAGGILGGISTGETIIFRAAIKPPSSIASEQKTIDIHGKEKSIKTEGRHDVCICPRIVPVIEAMCYLTLEDMYKTHATIHA